MQGSAGQYDQQPHLRTQAEMAVKTAATMVSDMEQSALEVAQEAEPATASKADVTAVRALEAAVREAVREVAATVVVVVTVMMATAIEVAEGEVARVAVRVVARVTMGEAAQGRNCHCRCSCHRLRPLLA
jgi:KaiC/GvpD/RAD55 family RecA-like ATPase